MVSFRLSEKEYGRFRELCFNNGIRSVSELARTGLNLMLQQPEQAARESLEERVTEIEGRLQMLFFGIESSESECRADYSTV